MSELTHIRDILGANLGEPQVGQANASLRGEVRTGFFDIDEFLGGLKRGNLIVIAARRGLGKSAIMLNIARNTAIGQGARVAIFSIELSVEQIAQRLLACESGVDPVRLPVDKCSEAEERRIMHAMGVLSEAEIYVDDSPTQHIRELREEATLHHTESSLDLVAIDYLQLLRRSRPDGSMEEMSDISRSLKQLARELDVPVVVCSHLTRGRPASGVPSLRDLDDSLTQDADVVLFIDMEEPHINAEDWALVNGDLPYPEGKAQVIIAKHRNGPTGTIDLRFRKQLTRFEDWQVREPEPEYV